MDYPKNYNIKWHNEDIVKYKNYFDNYTFVFNSKRHNSPFMCIMSKGIPPSCNTQSSTSGEYTRSLELNRVTVQYKDNKVVFNTHEINGAVSWYKLDVSDFEYIIPFD